MTRFNHSLTLALLFVPVAACTDDTGENLPNGGFTTGEDSDDPTTADPTTNNPATSNNPATTNNPSTTTESSSTGDPTTDSDTTTGDPTTDSDTTTGDPTTDSDDTTTTDPTDPTGSEETTDDPTDPTGMTECGNDEIEANEICFADGGTVATGAGATDVAAGDFDGDGNFDVIVTSATGTNVSVHLGDGAGALAAGLTTAVGNNPQRVVAGELSGDTSWDAIVANTDDDTVSVLIADGAGGFTETVVAVGDQPVGLSLGDLDDANGLDFAVANAGSVDYHTALNDGAGTFTTQGPWAPAGNVDAMAGIVLGSVAVGGTTDAFYGGGGFYAATNGNGDGTMNFDVSQGGNAGNTLGRMDGGDINGDGDLDVVAADGPLARVYLGQGGDANAGFQNDTFGPFGTTVSEALLADVTGEGDDDIIAVDRDNAVVVVISGNGDATFNEGDAQTFDVGATPEGVAVADLDGDGVSDIVVVSSGGADLTILLSNP
ncbi:MAG: FG-GAP repeat domain-containing protein [Nannocystaceae bacterium]|nr:VCBS repeat-containing protein [bacterium]